MFNKDSDFDSDFKSFFVPLTTVKAILILCLLGFCIYFFSFFNGFVRDDISQVVNNNLVHSLSNFFLFFRGATFGYGNYFSGGYYKPVMDICFAIIYSLFGPHAFFFHFFQVILFISNAVLVYIFFKQLFQNKTAFLLSVLFLIHPINSEVALYISDLQDILFFFFGMLSLITITHKNIYVSHGLSMVFLLCSLFSKETGVAFAFIIPAYLFLVKKKKVNDPLILEIIFVFISYVIIHLSLFSLQVNIKDFPFPMVRLPLPVRLLNIPLIIFFYIKTFFFPLNLSVSYDWIVHAPTFRNFYLPLLFDLSFFGCIAFIGRRVYTHIIKRYRLYLFFTFWFILGLALHLQIVPLDKTVAERWFYLPIVGLSGIIGLIFENFLSTRIKKIYLLNFFMVSLSILFGIFSLRTYLRTLNWTDNYTLTLHDISSSQDDFVSEAVLAQEYENQGKMDEGLTYIKLSIDSYPYWWQSWNNLGTVYATKAITTKDSKDVQRAEEAYQKAIALDSSIPIPYENLAGHYVMYNTDEHTTEIYIKELVKKFPYDDILWYYLALTENKLGDKQIALESIIQAQTLNPKDQRYSGMRYYLEHNLPIDIQE